MFLLLLLLLAVFSASLFFPPSDYDDMELLLVVEQQESPLSGFYDGWALAHNRWRPLHISTLWPLYRLFGVWAFPQQAINLILHYINACLLYRFIYKLDVGRKVSWGATAIFLISLYTVSPAVWVSNRPTLVLGLCALGCLNTLWHPRLGWPQALRLGALSILALISKESGLMLPLYALIVTLVENRRGRFQTALILVVLIILYVLFRIKYFPSVQIGPQESGYLLGTYYYEEYAHFSPLYRLGAAAENVLKGGLAPFLPIFNRNGGFYAPVELLLFAPSWVPTAWLSVEALRAPRKLSRAQWHALLLIMLSAMVHFGLFRHRNLYVSQMAVAILLASATMRWAQGTGMSEPAHRAALPRAQALAAILLLSSALWVRREVDFQATRRARLMARFRDPAAIQSPLPKAIAERYLPENELVAPGLIRNRLPQ
ncbi:MAG: hypothetical protein JXA74_04475 [Anaerolineae bacterium]|nr:hypothetical protein [Anaerolineae bacterium]